MGDVREKEVASSFDDVCTNHLSDVVAEGRVRVELQGLDVAVPHSPTPSLFCWAWGRATTSRFPTSPSTTIITSTTTTTKAADTKPVVKPPQAIPTENGAGSGNNTTSAQQQQQQHYTQPVLTNYTQPAP